MINYLAKYRAYYNGQLRHTGRRFTAKDAREVRKTALSFVAHYGQLLWLKNEKTGRYLIDNRGVNNVSETLRESSSAG